MSGNSTESTVGEQRFNVRALTITPNPFFRQGVRYCVRKRKQEPNRHPPVGFMACDPKVVV